MLFTRCPYDASPIVTEERGDGSTVLSCPTCEAAWVSQGSELRRVREPVRAAVRLARAAGTRASVVRGVPERATRNAT
jgi:hypothetical protein